PAAAVDGCGALRRHAALSPVGGRAPHAAAPGPARAQRTGDQPASRSAAGARPVDRAGGGALASGGRLSRRGAHRQPAGAARVPDDRAREEVRTDDVRRRRLPAVVALAEAMRDYAEARADFSCATPRNASAAWDRCALRQTSIT